MPNWVDAKIVRRKNRQVLRKAWLNAPAGTMKEKKARAMKGRSYMINSFFVRDATKRLSAIRKLRRYDAAKPFKQCIRLMTKKRVQLVYTGKDSYKVLIQLTLNA